MAEGVSLSPCLRILNICNNKFCDDAATARSLAEAFAASPCLKAVNLDGNLIGDEGAAVLLHVLRTSNHLTNLTVNNIRMMMRYHVE